MAGIAGSGKFAAMLAAKKKGKAEERGEPKMGRKKNAREEKAEMKPAMAKGKKPMAPPMRKPMPPTSMGPALGSFGGSY